MCCFYNLIRSLDISLFLVCADLNMYAKDLYLFWSRIFHETCVYVALKSLRLALAREYNFNENAQRSMRFAFVWFIQPRIQLFRPANSRLLSIINDHVQKQHFSIHHFISFIVALIGVGIISSKVIFFSTEISIFAQSNTVQKNELQNRSTAFYFKRFVFFR